MAKMTLKEQVENEYLKSSPKSESEWLDWSNKDDFFNRYHHDDIGRRNIYLFCKQNTVESKIIERIYHKRIKELLFSCLLGPWVPVMENKCERRLKVSECEGYEQWLIMVLEWKGYEQPDVNEEINTNYFDWLQDKKT